MQLLRGLPRCKCSKTPTDPSKNITRKQVSWLDSKAGNPHGNVVQVRKGQDDTNVKKKNKRTLFLSFFFFFFYCLDTRLRAVLYTPHSPLSWSTQAEEEMQRYTRERGRRERGSEREVRRRYSKGEEGDVTRKAKNLETSPLFVRALCI